MSHYIVISFTCPTPSCLSAICHTVHLRITQKLSSCCIVAESSVCVCVCGSYLFLCFFCAALHYSSLWSNPRVFCYPWCQLLTCPPSLTETLTGSALNPPRNDDLAPGPRQTARDLSRRETCLGNVCCTECVFMYVARHYRCILIRFSEPSQVCAPKRGKRLAGPPTKQSNHTFAKTKRKVMWQQFDTVSSFFLRGDFRME